MSEPPPLLPGGWSRNVSRSTGKTYYYNPGTKESLWHDDALPPGWAWGKTSEAAPKFYVHLASNARQANPPVAGQQAPPPPPLSSVSAPVVPHPHQAAAPSTSSTSSSSSSSSLPLIASLTAGDDLLSTAYLPDPAVQGANVPEPVRSKRDYLFSSIPPGSRWAVQVDDVSLYSVTEARVAEEMTARLAELVQPLARQRGGQGVIIDGTACVGGNTLSFARCPAFGRVVGVEISPQRAAMLRHNVGLLGQPSIVGKVGVVQGDFAALSCDDAWWARLGVTSSPVDVVFLDPPWGGPEYMSQPCIDMFLGRTDVAAVAAALTRPSPFCATPHPLVRWVAIKAPLNYNVEGVRRMLAAGGTGATLARVDGWKKMQMLLIQAAERPKQPVGPVAAALEGLRREAAAAAAAAARAQQQQQQHAAAANSSGVVASSGLKRSAAYLDEQDGSESSSGAGKAARARLEEETNGDGGAPPLRVAFQALLPRSRHNLPSAGANDISRTDGSAADASPAFDPLLPADLYLAPAATSSGSVQLLSSIAAPTSIGSSSGGQTDSSKAPPVWYDVSLVSSEAISAADADGAVKGLLVRLQPSAVAASITDYDAITVRLRPRPDLHCGLPILEITDQKGQTLSLAAPPSAVSATAVSSQQPLLLTPVFHGDIGHLLFSMNAATSDPSALAAAIPQPPPSSSRTPSSPLTSLLLGLGPSQLRDAHLPLPVAGLAGKGKRAAVLRLGGAGSGGLTLKVQSWDERVTGEVAVLAAMVQYQHQQQQQQQQSEKQAPSPLLAPLWLCRDASRCYVLMPDGGVPVPALLTSFSPGQGLPVPAVTAILKRVLAALSSLHAAGWLHCDVHPDNLLLLPPSASSSSPTASSSSSPWFDSCVLIDLGSAQPLPYAGPPRGGRWDVMPPEQFGEGQWASGGVIALTAASDLFSAASTAVWLLSGRAPFGPEQAGGKLTVGGTRGHPLRQPGAMRALLGPLLMTDGANASALLELLLRCLSPDPAARPQTAEEALRAL